MGDRIRRPKEYDDMLSDLAEKGIFPKYANALVFAACLGFKRDKRVSFDKSGDPIRMDVFNGPYDETIMHTISLMEKNGDALMLSKEREDDRIKIFEEYSAGGLAILKHEIWDPQMEWEPEIIRMIQDEGDNERDILDDITELAGL